MSALLGIFLLVCVSVHENVIERLGKESDGEREREGENTRLFLV